MAQIQVKHLTFYYDGSYDEIFRDVSLSIDTDWKLGFIGRNGKGKTTFLNLLMGKYEYKGTIISSEKFEYFPYGVKQLETLTLDLVEEIYPQYELWRVIRELNLLETDAEILYRPFYTLSGGERTKVMLAVLFSRENNFLLIDEPTNHLDTAARQAVGRYLNRKSGYILVSHDRAFLDSCIDHVLALNRNTIEVVQGNFSSWWTDKKRRDEFEAEENIKLKREIGRLKAAARQAENWSEKVEKTKYGTRIGGLRPDRGAIGHKAAKMMKRAKSAENRIDRAAKEKEKLLKDVEEHQPLKILPLTHHKDVLIRMENITLAYEPEGGRGAGAGNSGLEEGGKEVCEGFSMELCQGERAALLGKNGCGKSTVLRAILEAAKKNSGSPGETLAPGNSPENSLLTFGSGIQVKRGRIQTASGLTISYVSQDTGWLRGALSEFVSQYNLDETLFRAILRKLDVSREQFNKEMQYFSEGQKKKVLLAKSLCEKAHLYIWDEPLNFIDVFSRMQLEEMIKSYNLSMIFVEHDEAFVEKIADKRFVLQNHAEP